MARVPRSARQVSSTVAGMRESTLANLTRVCDEGSWLNVWRTVHNTSEAGKDMAPLRCAGPSIAGESTRREGSMDGRPSATGVAGSTE